MGTSPSSYIQVPPRDIGLKENFQICIHNLSHTTKCLIIIPIKLCNVILCFQLAFQRVQSQHWYNERFFSLIYANIIHQPGNLFISFSKFYRQSFLNQCLYLVHLAVFCFDKPLKMNLHRGTGHLILEAQTSSC